MDYDKFWKFIWKLIFCFCSILVISVTSCNMHVDYRISQAIKAGVNPIAAREAFSSTPNYTVSTIAGLESYNKSLESEK